MPEFKIDFSELYELVDKIGTILTDIHYETESLSEIDSEPLYNVPSRVEEIAHDLRCWSNDATELLSNLEAVAWDIEQEAAGA